MNPQLISEVLEGELSITGKRSQPFFQPAVGSNHKVIMTYGIEEVIEYEQFQKLSGAILSGQTGDFITVNNIIVQVKDIKMIIPTSEATSKRKAEHSVQVQATANIDQEKQQLTDLNINHRKEFMDAKFGVGKWTTRQLMSNRELMRELHASFDAKYPEEAQRIAELQTLSE